MNILICDDDKHYVDTIRKYVDEFFVERKITDFIWYMNITVEKRRRRILRRLI